jgi:hypothetical protein
MTLNPCLYSKDAALWYQWIFAPLQFLWLLHGLIAATLELISVSWAAWIVH